MTATLRIEKVRKGYGDTVAVDDASLDLDAGELHVLVGPSGCGKTSLLGAVAGFHDVDAGEITLDGERLEARPGSDRVVVFQQGSLFPWRTVLENVTYGPVVQGRLTKSEARELGRKRLADAGLAECDDLYPSQLSTGVARRVELVRALVNEPRVLLLDEPFRGMDQLTRGVMHEALLDFYDRSEVTVLFVTHDIEEAVFLGTRVSVMTTRPGRIKETIDVGLPRPRDQLLRAQPEFADVVQRVSNGVRAEARQAFERGERELA
ncbi:MAG TPA: ATP-binding cassette domain-containing protein [Thermoleophilaceae bacterium]|jgi:NitT/TauT family transport system ATP-binding protein